MVGDDDSGPADSKMIGILSARARFYALKLNLFGHFLGEVLLKLLSLCNLKNIRKVYKKI